MADESDNRKRKSSGYKPGNTGPDGQYLVGKGRTPKHTRFATGDGRERGRRPKGQKNFATEFEEESRRKVTIREGNKVRRVSKQRSVIIRAFDNAGSKGQNSAIQCIINQAQKISNTREPGNTGLGAEEKALVDEWIEQQCTQRLMGDNPGDPDSPANTDEETPGLDGSADDDI